MAFLVCCSENPPHDHVANKAIYLDQSFYELVFSRCHGEQGSFRTLGQIASLGYKSPVFVVSREQLPALVSELQQLASSGLFHLLLSELCAVCVSAQSKGYALTISADMYPELGPAKNASASNRDA
jgi:hypothetical protein